MSRASIAAAEEWRTCREKNARCGSETVSGPATLAAIVQAYIKNYQRGARAEMAFYAGLSSVGEVVRRASRAERPDGKRHGHQTRIRRNALRGVERRLIRLSFSKVRDFGELHSLIARTIGDISGIGELM